MIFKYFKPLFCVIDFVQNLSIYFNVNVSVLISYVEPIDRHQVSAQDGRKEETYFTFMYFDRW